MVCLWRVTRLLIDVYKMELRHAATVFENKVAPTTQGGMTQAPSATQTLVPNREQFTKPKKVFEFKCPARRAWVK